MPRDSAELQGQAWLLEVKKPVLLSHLPEFYEDFRQGALPPTGLILHPPKGGPSLVQGSWQSPGDTNTTILALCCLRTPSFHGENAFSCCWAAVGLWRTGQLWDCGEHSPF